MQLRESVVEGLHPKHVNTVELLSALGIHAELMLLKHVELLKKLPLPGADALGRSIV